MGFFGKIWKAASRTVGWAFSKLGKGITAMGKKLREIGIERITPEIVSELTQTIKSNKLYGTYDNIAKNVKMPLDKVFETDTLHKANYKTLFEVTLYDVNTKELINKHASIYSDKNTSLDDLEKEVDKLYKQNKEKYELGGYMVLQKRRVLVEHGTGSPY